MRISPFNKAVPRATLVLYPPAPEPTLSGLRVGIRAFERHVAGTEKALSQIVEAVGGMVGVLGRRAVCCGGGICAQAGKRLVYGLEAMEAVEGRYHVDVFHALLDVFVGLQAQGGELRGRNVDEARGRFQKSNLNALSCTGRLGTYVDCRLPTLLRLRPRLTGGENGHRHER